MVTKRKRKGRPAADLDAWAENQTRNVNECQTCAQKAVAEHLDAIVAAVERRFDKAGHNEVSLAAVHAKLLEDCPEAKGQSAVTGHLRRCRPDKFGKLWARRRRG